MNYQRMKRGVSRRAGRALGLAIAKTRAPIQVQGRGQGPCRSFATSDELIDFHFATWSVPDHPNRDSLARALRLLDQRSAVILETGSSAWGTSSSQLFDAYIATFGGEFTTVDLRVGPMVKLRNELNPNSTLVCGDSVRFLRRWVARNPRRRVDLVYLDSWDLAANDPIPSASHGLAELFAIRPALGGGSLLLVDDTPNELSLYADGQRSDAEAFTEHHGVLPGKGMLIDLYLTGQRGVEKVHHGYQALYRFD